MNGDSPQNLPNWTRIVVVIQLGLAAALVVAACGGEIGGGSGAASNSDRPDVPSNPVELVPSDATEVTILNVPEILGGDASAWAEEILVDPWADVYEENLGPADYCSPSSLPTCKDGPTGRSTW